MGTKQLDLPPVLRRARAGTFDRRPERALEAEPGGWLQQILFPCFGRLGIRLLRVTKEIAP